VLAKNFRVAQETFDDIPLHNLWIFPGDEPGDLEADQVAAGVEWGAMEPVIFRMSEVKPLYENSGGSVRIADSTNFSASKTVAAALVVVKPGSMRELHWHPNADEWQYYMKGSARMTVFNTGPHANTTDFRRRRRPGPPQLRPLRREHRRRRPGLHRNLPKRPPRRSLSRQLARPPATQTRLRTPQHPRGNPRHIPPQRPGNRPTALTMRAGHRHPAGAPLTERDPSPAGAGRSWLPGQLDLQLGAAILDLKFHFQMNLIRDVGDEPQVIPLDHDIIA
jgi:hypothetical protein